MSTINLYQTTQERLCKAICAICAKCYEQGFNTLVVTGNADLSKSIDDLLWTFSQKSFIPHALITDELFEQHPIIITSIEEKKISDKSFANFTALVLVETFELVVGNFTKTMLFFTQENKDQAVEFRKTTLSPSRYYVQNSQAGWDELL